MSGGAGQARAYPKTPDPPRWTTDTSAWEVFLVQVSYSDPHLRAAIHGLLDTAFPRLSERIRIAAGLGASWHEASTPFVRLAGQRPVAHVGVIPVPAVVGGRRVLVGGIHAVCTHPAWRGRGHCRALMTEALKHCERRFVVTWLFTDQPQLYRRFGFRLVTEYRFETGVDPDRRRNGTGTLRRLRAGRREDVDLLHRLLKGRDPVSSELAVVDDGWLFLLNEAIASSGLQRLYHAEDLDAVVACAARGRTLHLLDLVGERLPPVDEVVRRVPGDFERVVVHFPPDRLGGGPWEATPRDGEDRLMVRGSLGIEQQPFCVSPLGRC